MSHNAPDLPEPIDVHFRWSIASVTIARTVNKLIRITRWLIEASDSPRSLAMQVMQLRNQVTALDKQVAELRDLDRPRIVLKAGLPAEKPL